MNVGNRKLFSNRDARSKLSSMGGIMASSPELMGEAQRFAVGDEVVVPKFIINIPGLVPAGRFLQIDASTLQMLQQTIPDLMTQKDVLIEEATPALLDQINPYSLIESGDREVVDRLQDMGIEVPQSEAEGPGIMDRVSSLFGFGGDDSAAFVPRFPNDTQFQQDMVARDATPPAEVAGIETLGDVVAQNPQTANRRAALDKLKEQFSNMALFPDSAQRGENLSRFLAGAIDTPSGAVSAPQTESEQLLAASLPMNVAADSGPESGMFYDDVKGGFNIMPPAAYDAETPAEREARILAESMALIAERDPSGEAIARIDDGTSISSRVNPNDGTSTSSRVNEIINAQAGMSQEQLNAQTAPLTSTQGAGEDLLTGNDDQRSEAEILLQVQQATDPGAVRENIDLAYSGRGDLYNKSMAGMNAQVRKLSDEELLLLARDNNDERYVAALEEAAKRKLDLGTDPFVALGPEKRDIRITRQTAENALRAAEADIRAATTTEQTTAALAEKARAEAQIVELSGPLSAEQALIDKEAALPPSVFASSEDLVQGNASIGGYDEITLPSSPVDNKQLIERINAEGTSGTEVKPETAKEFRDKEADLVNAQGGLNSMPIVPDVMEKIEVDGAGGAGTGTTLFSPSTVKDYQKMYADMLGGKDKDSAKDKWNDFAMLGFAIAAGQDPNALTNIAQGLFATEKMKKEDRSIEQARQDKINMMAIESANQDRRAAIAAGASVTAANLKYNRDVKLIDQRAGIATDAATEVAKTTAERDKLKADALIEAARVKRANTSFLGSDRGKQMAKIFSTNPTQLSDQDKLTEMSGTFSKDAMERFRSAMSIVGTGVTSSNVNDDKFLARANANKGDGK